MRVSDASQDPIMATSEAATALWHLSGEISNQVPDGASASMGPGLDLLDLQNFLSWDLDDIVGMTHSRAETADNLTWLETTDGGEQQ